MYRAFYVAPAVVVCESWPQHCYERKTIQYYVIIVLVQEWPRLGIWYWGDLVGSKPLKGRNVSLLADFIFQLMCENAAGRHQSGLKVPLIKTLYKKTNYECRLGETQIIAQGKQTRRDKRMKRRTINKELGWVSLSQKFWYVFSYFWMLIHLALWGTTNEPNVLKFVGFDLNISCWYGKADSYIWARRANEP